jgi:putative ABC transport system permease protein
VRRERCVERHGDDAVEEADPGALGETVQGAGLARDAGRDSVGARRRDVFLQILAESTVIGIIGGLLGLGAGVLLLELLERLAPLESPPVIEPSAILISVGFASAVGVLSGLYPAWRASRLDPIAALRYE